MNITSKIIITNTNIITDLSTANVLSDFIKLDNVYISDVLKNKEIYNSTGNIELIKKFKVIQSTANQLLETKSIKLNNKRLSMVDINNYILARDNNCILATGDNLLKKFAEKNNITVIRTLKIIRLMYEKGIITKKKAINACKLLEINPFTRIPIENINELINELEKDLVTC